MQLTGSDCIDRTAQHQYECQGSITGLVTDSQSTSGLNQLSGSNRWKKKPKETKQSGSLAHLQENEENDPKVQRRLNLTFHFLYIYRSFQSPL